MSPVRSRMADAAVDPAGPQALNDDERRGYLIACRTMQMWGAQIEAAVVSTAGGGDMLSRAAVQEYSGRLMCELATALEQSAS